MDTEIKPQARILTEMTSLPQVISEEFLTCKICLDEFKQPKILACLHTFCFSCLSEHALRNQFASIIPCPVCRQDTDISRGGIAGLRDNFFIAGLQDVVSLDQSLVAGPRGCDSCTARGEKKVAKTRCLNCQEYLCEDCNDAHGRLNLTKNHICILYNPDKPPSKLPAISPRPPQTSYNQTSPVYSQPGTSSSQTGSSPNHLAPNKLGIGFRQPSPPPKPVIHCKYHEKEESKLYCDQCKVPICIPCKLTSHENHKCTDLEQAENSERNQLGRLVRNLKVKSGQCDKLLKVWENYEKELEGQEKQASCEIERRRDKLHKMVDSWYNNVACHLKNNCWQERQLIQGKMSAIKEQVSNSSSVSEGLEEILENMTSQQLFNLADQIRTQSRNLERDGIMALALTMKMVMNCNTPTDFNETEAFGSLEVTYSKLHPSALNLTQNLTLVRKFETRPTSEYRLRFDASSLMTGTDGTLVVTDRQLDRLAVYNVEGRTLLTVNMSLMGKPTSAAQLPNGDLVIIREKSSMCLFGPNGRDKRLIKETLSKPCCLTLDKDGNFLVLDYDLKTAMIFSAATYTRIGQVRLPYKTGSKWDKLVVGANGNLYICAHRENCIYEYNPKGKKVNQFGRGGNNGAGELYWPRGLTMDNEGNLVIADSGNDCIQLLTPQGYWISLITPEGARMKCPTDVTVLEDGSICVLESTGTIKIFQYAP